MQQLSGPMCFAKSVVA